MQHVHISENKYQEGLTQDMLFTY